MRLSAAQWPDFFAAVHGTDRRPFRWQTRLLDLLLAEGRWPEQIAAPTGAGKTAVIDVHVFAVALMACGAGPQVPRRLALVVDRRALVDDQYAHARRLAHLLAASSDPANTAPAASPATSQAVLEAVAAALHRLRWPGAPHEASKPLSPLVTARLRGGLPPPRAWRDDPVACAVLCATPDMWGSRLLLRGYGASTGARPREAGLLARDAVVVVDEAHLSRQLVRTARRVAELQQRTEPDLGVPPLQVVATTATPDPAIGRVVGVEDGDLDVDEPLRVRLRTPKSVRLLELPAWPSQPGKQRPAVVDQIVDRVIRLRKQFGPTVGCFLNTVPAAVAVHEALTARGLTAVLLVGRMRPHDVDELRRNRPGLLDITGNTEVDVMVATQTLEVGIDVDLSAAVTELAPGTALAQRAGRVNRLGTRPATQVVVATAGALPNEGKTLGPYHTDDIAEALTWARRRAADPAGLAPQALRADGGDPPRSQTRRRTLLHRVELGDAWQWARTSDELAAEPDLTLWLADDLAEQPDVGIVVRRALPDTDTDLAVLLRDAPPRPHEVFPTPFGLARKALEQLADQQEHPPIARIRQQDVAVIRDKADIAAQLRPGDLVVIDDRAAIFRSGVVDDGTGGQQASDVFDALVPDIDGQADDRKHAGQGSGPVRPAGRAVRIERDGWAHTVDPGLVDAVLLAAVPAAADKPTRDDRDALADALTALATTAAEGKDALDWVARRLKDRKTALQHTDVIVHGFDGPPHRLLVIDTRRVGHDEDLRQTWTCASSPVLLDSHAHAVADRAATLARAVGLPADAIEVLRLAGHHHDDGKTDIRFQAMLRRGEKPDTDAEVLAKSGVTSPTRARASWSAAGLPAGWRHEQLSIVQAWPHLAGLPTEHRQLVARLVGTSHGHGRHSFPHTAAELTPFDEPALATALFDHGGWDELIEQTTRTWGVWGCAYLEALLRAADGQISAEGS